MVETISPVVHGGRNRSYWTSIALHVLGATISAAAFGAVLGGAGALVGAPWGAIGPALLAVAAALYLLREAFRLPIPTFERKQQVPDWWRTFYSKPVASFLYGLGLGIGFLTFLTFGTYVPVVLGAFLIGDPLVGAGVTGVFGLARALAVAGQPSMDRLEQAGSGSTPRFVNAAFIALLLGAALLAL